MLVGAGALRAHATEVIEVAELLGAGVAKALLGKAARARRPAVRHRLDRPARHQAPSWDMMQDCDTLLMVGSSFPYSEFLPEGGPGPRRPDRHRRPHARHPLPDGGQPRRRQRGDAARAAAAAQRKDDRSWREKIEENVARLVGDARRAGARAAPTRSTPSSSSTSSPSACPTARSSPPTPARPRTGAPATCGCAAG